MKPMPKPVKCVCGKEPEVVQPLDDRREWIVTCRWCWCGPWKKTKRSAIEAWNAVMGRKR
jgi:hypothetical protein